MIDVTSLGSFGLLFAQTLSLRDLYFQWEGAGVFEFLLPALLVFAIVFGILTSTKVLGGNRGINFIISIAVALIAMQSAFVSEFFSVVFPNLGIGLAILLVVLIFMGLFVSKGNFMEFSNTLMWGGLVLAVIIAVITLNQFAWFGSIWWQENWISALWILIIILIMAPFLMPTKTQAEKDATRQRFWSEPKTITIRD